MHIAFKQTNYGIDCSHIGAIAIGLEGYCLKIRGEGTGVGSTLIGPCSRVHSRVMLNKIMKMVVMDKVVMNKVVWNRVAMNKLVMNKVFFFFFL